MLDLVSNLDKSRFEPVILSFTEGPMVDRAKAMGIETEIIHTERPFDFRVWGRVRQMMKRQGVHLVHAHGSRAASNTLTPARRSGLPFLYTVHGWGFHRGQSALVRRVRLLGERWITSRSDITISVSRANQETGKNHFRGFESIVIPNGIDPEKFNPGKAFVDVRKELGIPREKRLILFMARFTAHKQPLRLLEAFNRASLIDPDLCLLMVGEGDEKAQAVTRARALGLDRKIWFQPFRSDTPDILAAADLFVLPSQWEGMAISLLEAMALGKTVIASRVDGNAEVVSHAENGWLVDLDHIEDHLCEAFLKLGRDEALCRRLGQRAMETIRQKYTVAGMTRQTEEIYQNLYLTAQDRPSLKNTYPYGV